MKSAQLVCVLGLACVLAACPQPPGSDAGQGACDASALGECHPTPCSTGNSIHVGAYCSAGGGECDRYGLPCADDLQAGANANFCIRIGCTTNEACMEGACCTGESGSPIHACIPLNCVSDNGTCPPVPFLDAGGGDGGGDAGTPSDGGPSEGGVASDASGDAGAADSGANDGGLSD